MNNNELIGGVFLFLISTLPSAAAPCLITGHPESPPWSNAQRWAEAPVSHRAVGLEKASFFLSPPSLSFIFILCPEMKYTYQCLRVLTRLFCFVLYRKHHRHPGTYLNLITSELLLCSSNHRAKSPSISKGRESARPEMECTLAGSEVEQSPPHNLHSIKQC